MLRSNISVEMADRFRGRRAITRHHGTLVDAARKLRHMEAGAAAEAPDELLRIHLRQLPAVLLHHPGDAVEEISVLRER